MQLDLMFINAFAVLGATFAAVGPRNNYGIKPPPKQDIYEYWLQIHMGLTMAPITFGDYKKLLVYNMSDQKYYPRDGSTKASCDAMLPASNFTTDQIPTADGLHKHFVGVNGTLPGPAIVVYQHSTLIVHVTNYLLAPVTIHFHGLDFHNEFYMDGAGMITQCPISHGQTFTYRFKVTNNPGTYWYHGHDSAEMSEGLFGAFIILDPNNQPESNDFISMLTDWYPNSTETLFWVDEAGHNKYMYGYDRTDKCYYKSFDAQGVRATAKPFYSALINGKGWHNVDELDQFLTRLPVERFIIDPNKNSTRFRLISTTYEQPFYVHVDGHQLEIIASDGEAIQSRIVDGIYIYAGERYDVRLSRRSFGQQHFKFWLDTTDTLDQNNQRNEEEFRKHHTLGIVSYSDEEVLPDFLPEQNDFCNPCLILNCPFAEHPSPKFRCVHLTKLQAEKSGRAEVLQATNVVNKFFEYHFEDANDTVNGIQFMMPHHPPFMHARNLDHAITRCPNAECGIRDAKTCYCTYIVELELGQIYQFTIYTSIWPEGDIKNGMGHPFHLHGQHFYIMKSGFAIQSPETGLATNSSKDITCSNYWCNHATFANSAWLTSLPNDANLINPILKDTVFIPYGGYVIIRFKAENPGWWFSHCHFLKHHLGGMAVLFKVGTDAQIPLPPDDFPVCGFSMGQMRNAMGSRAGINRYDWFSNWAATMFILPILTELYMRL